MSISSALAAERAEEKRVEWLKKLQSAFDTGDWYLIKKLIDEINDYRFEE